MTISKFKKTAISLCVGLLSLTYVLPANSADYGLPEKIEDGNILHCFNWSINEVRANLQSIAEAGFGAVQLSPMQRPSAKPGDAWNDLYRPYDLAFQESEAMGTAEDLKNLCEEAKAYGIKVIVDVVANHLDKVNYNNTWWDVAGNQTRLRLNPDPSISYSNRTSITTGLIGDYAVEINSEAQAVLQKAKSYVTTLSNYGVSGIRWDAAKHIGVPSEGSNFWPTVTDAVPGMFHYGEILDNPCTSNYGDLVKEYGEYMAVTDTYFSNEAAQSNNGIPKRKNGEYGPLVGKNKLIYWAESHDTYSNTPQFGGWSNSVDQSVINRAYAAVACRDGAVALYLARPGATGFSNIKLGKSSNAEQDNKGFLSNVVVEVNKFRNAMNGREEYFTKSEDGKAICIARNNGGAVIITEPNANFTVPNGGGYCPVIASTNGRLKDKISGNNITVTSETISGQAGETGVVVIYVTTTSAKPNVEIQDFEPVDMTIYYDNTLTQWSQVYCHYWGGTEETSFPGLPMTKVENDAYGRDLYSISVPYGSNVLFDANRSPQTVNQKDAEPDHVYKGLLTLEDGKHKVFDSGIFGEEPLPDPDGKDPNKITVYYDNSDTGYDPVYCYYYGGVESGPSFPGTIMTLVTGQIYKITIPTGSTAIFSTGSNTAQTQNVTGVKDSYLYKGGEKGSNGKNTVEEIGLYVEEENTDPEPELPENITIYYDNSLTKFEEPVSCYYFATGVSTPSFPGLAMEKVKDDIYTLTIPYGEWKLLFDNGVKSGDGMRQTENSHGIAKDGYIYKGQIELDSKNRNLLDDGKTYEEETQGGDDPNIEPHKITVYVASQTQPYLYVWNGSDKLNGNFPGTLMNENKTSIGSNEYYTQTFTGYESINLILTNEDKVQTQNIENVSEDIYINWSGDNRYEIIADPEAELKNWADIELVTVYYDNTETRWPYVNCYTYGDAGEYLGGFSGKAMNSLGENYEEIYYIEVPKGNSVIFSYEGSENQTVDLDNAQEGDLFIGNSTPNTDGKYEVTRTVFSEKEEEDDPNKDPEEQPEEDPEDQPEDDPEDNPDTPNTPEYPEEEPSEYITIFYDDIYTNYSLSGQIGKVHCYYYIEDYDFEGWPGDEMERWYNTGLELMSSRSGMDQVLYKIEIPKNISGVIFNDGGEENNLQTIEITQKDLLHNRIYIGQRETDENNHHSVAIGGLYGDTSGIEGIIYDQDVIFYDLNGMPVKNPQKGKIYIKEGKKVLIF